MTAGLSVSREEDTHRRAKEGLHYSLVAVLVQSYRTFGIRLPQRFYTE